MTNRQILDAALRRLQPHISSGRIVGLDAAAFLFVERGDRSMEIYGNGDDTVIIDPAIDDELQGEIKYRSFDLAIDAARLWLHGCTLDQLPPPE